MYFILYLSFKTNETVKDLLVEEKIQIVSLLVPNLLKVPMSSYDLATIDEITKESVKYLDSIVVENNEGKIMSYRLSEHFKTVKEVTKFKNTKYIHKNKEDVHIVQVQELYLDKFYMGKIYMVFDLQEVQAFVQKQNMEIFWLSFVLVLLPLVITGYVSKNLVTKLYKITDKSKLIGKTMVEFPYVNEKNEIGELASTLDQAEKEILKRNKQIQQQVDVLRKNRKELIELSKSKDDFLANVSHELRTPLNSINIISSVMKENKDLNLSEKDIKNLQIINNCGKDLMYLVNDILDISKIEAGEIILSPINITADDMVREVLSMFENLSEQKNTFKYIDNTEGILLNVDEKRYKQVLKNLISNSNKFTNQGEIKIETSIVEDKLQTKVVDNGIGISKDKLESIFDRFKQADGSTTRKYGGTGLGLSIVKSLTEVMGGEVSVVSEENIGTQFTFTIQKHLKIQQQEKQITKKQISKTNQQEKEEVYVLNKDPQKMFNNIVKLNRQYKVIQITKEEQIVKNLKTFVLKEDKDLISSEYKTNIIIIVQNNEKIQGYETITL